MPVPPSLLKKIRLTHLYIGVFLSPAILFFALTGAMQTFGLHDVSPNGARPPAWIATLAQIHKKQSPVIPAQKLRSQTPADELHQSAIDSARKAVDRPSHPSAIPPSGRSPRNHHPLPLKIFFLFVCIGLFLSTLSGVYMTYKFNRNKAVVTGLLVAGIALPLILLAI